MVKVTAKQKNKYRIFSNLIRKILHFQSAKKSDAD